MGTKTATLEFQRIQCLSVVPVAFYSLHSQDRKTEQNNFYQVKVTSFLQIYVPN